MGERFHGVAVAAVALLCLVPAARETRLRAAADGEPACPGAAIRADRVITGRFAREQMGAYVLVPFEVPAGTTAVRVKYCFDQPPEPIAQQLRHTLDLGLYQATRDGFWGREEFRGWGGSSHPDVTVSPQGFSTEAQYRAAPRGHVPGRTTRGFRPGPIPAGRWAVELGVAAVVGPSEGDPDGVAWRVELELARDPAFAREPYRPARYDSRPARAAAGWYAGDFHVHAEHSALGDATMTETFDYAFRPLAQGGAGLDFLNLSDYVTDTGWGEVGRHQARHPGKAILRSSEVITYRGHLHNSASGRYVDYRTGPVFERRADGSSVLRRAARPASAVLADVQRAGGFTQINHPTIFPSSVPGFAGLCRGCPWDYPAAETSYGLVDAVEVATGPAGADTLPGDPGPSPFVVTAISFWEDALDAGHHVAAVGSSDSHNAGRVNNQVTQTPIGEATTVVYADELSERGIQRGVEAGHTYVKLFGNRGADLRFEARAPGRPAAIMGDTIDAPAVELVARVLNATGEGSYELQVLRGREVVSRRAVSGGETTVSLPGTGPGRYRLQLMRGSAVDAVSSPIWVGPRTEALRVRAIVGSHTKVRRGRILAGCRASGTDVRDCDVRILRRGVEIGAGRAPVTGGRAMVEARVTAAGLRLLRSHRGLVPVAVEVSALDREGRAATVTRRTRLRLLIR